MIRRDPRAKFGCLVPDHRDEDHRRFRRLACYHGAAEVSGESPLEGASDVAGDGPGSAADEMLDVSPAGDFSTAALGGVDCWVILCPVAGTLGVADFTVLVDPGGLEPVPSSAARETTLRTAARFSPAAFRVEIGRASCRER